MVMRLGGVGMGFSKLGERLGVFLEWLRGFMVGFFVLMF